MGKTYSTLQTAIADYLNRDDLTSPIQDAIEIAQRKLESLHDWRCLRKTDTGSTVADQDYIDFPTDYRSTFSFFIKNTDGDWIKIDHLQMPWGYVDNPDPVNDTGLPESFMADYENDKILLTPTPDDTYEYVHYYYANLDILSDSITTNWWTDHAWELLLYGALMEMEPYLQNDARLMTWKALYDKRVEDMKKEETDSNISGSTQTKRATIGII